MTFEEHYRCALGVEQVATTLEQPLRWFIFTKTPFAEYLETVAQRGTTYDGRYSLICTEAFAVYCRSIGTPATLEA